LPIELKENLRQIFVALAPTLRRRRLFDADVDNDVAPAIMSLGGGCVTKLLEASCVGATTDRWQGYKTFFFFFPQGQAK
jgi:hypothetical protein